MSGIGFVLGAIAVYLVGMLVIGFAILGTLVSRIRIAQALKLGED